MPTDDSIPASEPAADASSPDVSVGADQHTDRAARRAAGVEQANTVIRGSSRAGLLGDAATRSPAVITKVLVGQHLNQYLIQDLIGGGGMGAVFRAHDEQLDREVAIKVIPFVGDDVELQRRFRNEAQSAAKLDDLRIARVYDAGHHEEWHYIVFEYVEGTNIRNQVVANGVFTIDDAVFYTSQLAGAIQHLADRGIVHRDIKPSNVIISNNGTLKLVDMGLARSEHLDMSDDMTASGVTLGTFDYISPEQARDPRNADVRSDIYSLGCTLYFMLTGSPPYPGGTMAQKLISHGTAPPPDVQELRPAVSPHLTAVLNKMLAKSPADRYANANDLLSDLCEVAKRDGLNKTYELVPQPIGQNEYAQTRLYHYSPWIAAFAVLLASVGWLRLESASLRDEVTIQEGAAAPYPVIDADHPEIESLTDPVPLDASAANPTRDVPSPTIDQNSIDTDPDESSMTRRPFPSNLFPIEPARQDDNDSASLEVDDSRARLDQNLRSDPPRVIRLVDDELRSQQIDENGAALTNSFSDAVRMARLFGVSQIEITSPIVRSGPVRIGGSEPLIIRSTIGGSTIIFGQDQERDDATGALVTIANDRLEFGDLHFVAESESSASFFSIRGSRQVRMNRCSVTVFPQPDDTDFYCFKVLPASVWQRFGQRLRDATQLQVSKIEIRNSVIRGDASMLSIDGDANLSLTWDNGLLAVSGRMVEATGTRDEPDTKLRRSIELVLTRLTAHVPNGVARIRMTNATPYPISIDRQALNSLFLIDSGRAQFEWSGLAAPVSPDDVLRLRGTSNAYCVDRRGSDLVLRVASDQNPTQLVSVDDIQSDLPDWFQDSSPRWIDNPWIDSELDAVALKDQTVQDYRQSGFTAAGFDSESLPSIPSVQGTRQIESSRQGVSGGGLSTNRNFEKMAEITTDSETDLTFRRSLDLIGESSEANERP